MASGFFHSENMSRFAENNAPQLRVIAEVPLVSMISMSGQNFAPENPVTVYNVTKYCGKHKSYPPKKEYLGFPLRGGLVYGDIRKNGVWENRCLQPQICGQKHQNGKKDMIGLVICTFFYNADDKHLRITINRPPNPSKEPVFQGG
jgi:hypothetical protein